MIMLEYRQTYTDATEGYNVVMTEKYMLEDFVREVAEVDSFKEGNIKVLSKEYNPSAYHLSECCTIEYADDVKIKVHNPILEEKAAMENVLKREVERADALDCWNGRYCFKVWVA